MLSVHLIFPLRVILPHKGPLWKQELSLSCAYPGPNNQDMVLIYDFNLLFVSIVFIFYLFNCLCVSVTCIEHLKLIIILAEKYATANNILDLHIRLSKLIDHSDIFQTQLRNKM